MLIANVVGAHHRRGPSHRGWEGATPGRDARDLTPSAACRGVSRMRITRAGTPATTALAGTSVVSTALVPMMAFSPTVTPRSTQRAVADPDVVRDAHVALVDPLHADRALHLGDAVVEVDQHHAVGDDALAPDRDVLEGRDRALLADHGLGSDLHLALVHAQLAAVPDPCPAPDPQRRVAPDLELHARAQKADAVGLQTFAEAQLQVRQACQQQRVGGCQHPVRAHEAQQRQRPPVQGACASRAAVAADAAAPRGSPRLRPAPSAANRRGPVAPGAPAMIARSMEDPTLAQRLLDGDRRALARAISLVEDDRPEGWKLVREVYPHTGAGHRGGLHRSAGGGRVDPDRSPHRRPPASREDGRRRSRSTPPRRSPRGAAGRPHPPHRALPRPGRVHPLDGQPGRPRRPVRRRRCRPRCCSTPPGARTSTSRPSASARRRSTSSTTPTRSCSC